MGISEGEGSEEGALATPRIKTCSWSRLEVFEKCKYQAKLKYLDKIPEPDTPKRTEALNRGKAIHEMAEKYVKGEIDQLPKELQKFATSFEESRDLFLQGKVIAEEDWGFDTNWVPTGWWDDDVWLRMSLDLLTWTSEEQDKCKVVDYKSGKKFGNEVKHNQQGVLYGLGTLAKFPEVTEIEVSFEYLDHGKTSRRKVYSRDNLMKLKPFYDKRLRTMTEATEFPPAPNAINCRWCPFGPNGGNDECKYGVEV